jgi:hypothetical protein
LPDEEAQKMGDLAIDFCGEWYEPSDEDIFNIGREGDLEVDDNPYLHRQFLQVANYDGIWWLSNVGSMLSATVADASGGMQAWLSPGARIPLVFSHTNIIFTAGPTTYEFAVHLKTPSFRQERQRRTATGTPPSARWSSRTRRRHSSWRSPSPCCGAKAPASAPSRPPRQPRGRWAGHSPGSTGNWTTCATNWTGPALWACAGGGGKLATNRRARLVEHAVTSHLVTADDLSPPRKDAGVDEG